MKIIYAFIFIFIISSCEPKEDKGDTEKFIGIWKVDSYIINDEQLMSESNWVSGTIKITNSMIVWSDFGGWGYGHGKYKEEIYFTTEEKWIASQEWDKKLDGCIRFEKGSIVRLETFSNRQIQGVYELNGNQLVIRGAEDAGQLHHIILTRYSY